MGERSAEDLLFAVCHEIGNLLAATRLHAGLLARRSDPVEGASTVAGLAVRGGALLPLVRPLLGRSAPRADAVPPAEILRRLEQELCELGATQVRVDAAAAERLPPARLDAELVYAVLLAWVLAAVDSLAEAETLRVWAEERDGAIALIAEGGAAGDAGPTGGRPSGRSLVCALGARVLGGQGVRVEGASDLRRLSLEAPRAGS